MGAIFSIKRAFQFWIFILLGVCIFSGCSHGNNNDKLVISGNIEFTEVAIAFKSPGRLIKINVDEGDFVKSGDRIAALDQEELLNESDRTNAALHAAEAKVLKMETALELQQANTKKQVDLRKAELKQAEAMLKEMEAGSRSQEIEKARAATIRAQTEFDQARRDWERAEVLYKNKDIPPSQYEKYRTNFESYQASLKQAEEQLALVVEGPRAEDIEAARSQVERAKAALGLAEAQRLKTKMKEVELNMANADANRAKAELAIIKTRLSDSVATSPIDGVVLVKAAEAGEVLSTGMPVVVIGDIHHPWLRGYISEPYLDRVKLNTKVKIKTDSGREFLGRVSYISPQAEFTPKQIQTQEERVMLVYRIKVNVENPDGALKLNMPVEGEIILE